jgi:hypothetical protein
MNVSLSALLRTGCGSLFLIAAAVAATTASAGTIQSIPAPVASGPGLGTVAVPAIFTLTPNNDNVAVAGVNDNNIFVPIKRFDSIGYIDIEFTVDVSGGTTEYQVYESVDNNTGIDWNRYEMYLGFGTGENFRMATPGDGLDFDDPDFDAPPVSSALSSVSSPNEDTLIFSNGTHGTGAESYVVRIDVSDLTLPPLGALTFTLRQVPVGVPEPGTLLLVGLALAGFAAYRPRG